MSEFEQVIGIIRDIVIICCVVLITTLFVWICVRLNTIIKILITASDNVDNVVGGLVGAFSGPGNILRGLSKGLSFLLRVKDKSD